MKKLKDGIQKVKITQVIKGISDLKKTPYFQCRFENQDRYLEERFYITKGSLKYIQMFYIKAGAEYKDFNGDGLLSKELYMIIGPGRRIDKNGKAVKFPKIIKFLSTSEYTTNKNNYNDRVFDEYDIYSAAEIFGGDVEEIASELGVDPSQLTTGDIEEYFGY